MATAAVIRQRIRDNVYSAALNERPFASLTNGSITDSATSVVVDEGDYFSMGDIIEFLDDGEQCYVTASAVETLTIIRGWNGTTAAAQADNSIIIKNPRLSVKQIDDATTATLHQLGTLGVHTWGYGEITLVAGQEWYDLTATDILDYPGVVWLGYVENTTTDLPISLPFKYETHMKSDITTSTHGLHVWDWGDKAAGAKLYFTYAQVIDATTDLLSRQEELVVLGATARLLGKVLAPRTHDPGRLTDKNLDPKYDVNSARWYQAEFFMQSRVEAGLLRAEARQHANNVQLAHARRWHP